ncbi:NfeD family protein [Pyrobaculum sp.]|uniref:NfeD family protein n=1 Tax=Pyrobaculum sp. TaxID=2004705 RepID=UPI003164E05A
MDVALSSATLGLLGAVILVLTVAGRIPALIGYPLGGSFVALYLLILVVGLKSARDFRKRPTPSASVVGKRGVVVESNRSWALIKLEGAYWRVFCEGCSPGDVVEIVRVTDAGVVARKIS